MAPDHLEEEMDLKRAKQKLDNLDLPIWVKQREVEQSVDFEFEPFVRVWLDVDEDFDFDAHEDEVVQVETDVEEALYALDRDQWIAVSIRTPIEHLDE